MKGKILAGIVLGCIGAIYAFLIYPLLKGTEPHNTEYPLPCLVGVGEENGSFSASQQSSGDCLPAQYPVVKTESNKAPLIAIGSTGESMGTNTICFQEYCFSIEIADTFASRQQGLMNREVLQQNAGMLFVFDTPGSYGFWMKNTLIPLDIIWMNENFIVVDTATMEPCIADPCSTYNHSGVAMYALEINAGLVDKYGIKQGDIFIQK